MKKNIFIAGHNGMVGKAIKRHLEKSTFERPKLITAERKELDLRDQNSVQEFFQNNKIDEIYLCAAKVGGILANSKFPADFIYDNLMIQANVIHAAYQANVKKLLFLGSSCIYPKFAKTRLMKVCYFQVI